MMSPQLKELLLQSLVHERGGVLVYRTALECVVHDELRDEWEKYLQQTEHHVEVLTRVCTLLGLDPGEMTPGCQIVHENGKALVVGLPSFHSALNSGVPRPNNAALNMSS